MKWNSEGHPDFTSEDVQRVMSPADNDFSIDVNFKESDICLVITEDDELQLAKWCEDFVDDVPRWSDAYTGDEYKVKCWSEIERP